MAKQSYDAVIAAPFGRLGVTFKHGRLADIDFLGARHPLRAPKETAARRACRALKTYLRNPNTKLRLPLEIGGSDFQRRVWQALRRIPAGKVLSYGELAHKLKTGPRAVGNACRTNPIPIVIPCHRVVAAGYGDVQGRTSPLRGGKPRTAAGGTTAGTREVEQRKERLPKKPRAAMGGFMGKTGGRALAIKDWLLAHERGR